MLFSDLVKGLLLLVVVVVRFWFWFSRQGFSLLELVDQAGLDLRGPPASASQVLRLKVCATTGGGEVYVYVL